MPQTGIIAIFRPSAALVDDLREAGLRARMEAFHDAEALARLLTEADSPVAGLMEWRSPLRPDVLAEARRCLISQPLSWVAVVDRTLLADSGVRALLASHCLDYHHPPLDPQWLGHSLGHALGMAALQPPRFAADVTPGEGLLGNSAAMQRVRQQVQACARVSAPVLVTGESGTGKELVARALHAASLRCRGPFVPVNCGGLPEGLIQSELFGHKRGAFTGALSDREGKVEAAQGGSLFLDEIGDLPRPLQVHLLRFLQEGTIEKLGSTRPVRVDVRVIAATHVDLGRAVAEGRFREDLHYRLNVLQIALPPLRDRREDIALLADHCLRRYAGEVSRAPWGYTDAAYRALQSHDWPGNVRELVNVVRRAIVMHSGRYIDVDALVTDTGPMPEVPPRALSEVRAEADRQAIEASLRATRHNVSAASRLLNISRLSLYRLMEKYHVQMPRKSD